MNKKKSWFILKNIRIQKALFILAFTTIRRFLRESELQILEVRFRKQF